MPQSRTALLDRLIPWRRSPVSAGQLRAIYVSPAAGQAMVALERAQAVAGAGLADDRYCLGSGFWKATDGCQLTIMTERALQRVMRRGGTELAPALAAGSHRRNLIIGGLGDAQFEGQCFVIGTALFEFERWRPPCGYIDQVAGSGTCRALGRDSGACVRVIQGGGIAIGDEVRLVSGQ